MKHQKHFLTSSSHGEKTGNPIHRPEGSSQLRLEIGKGGGMGVLKKSLAVAARRVAAPLSKQD